MPATFERYLTSSNTQNDIITGPFSISVMCDGDFSFKALDS